MMPRSRLAAGLFFVGAVVVVGAGCFDLDRVVALPTGGVVGQALRPDLDDEGAGFTTINGVGSNVVRRADDAGRFEVRGLAAGRFDLRLVDDVDGDGWADRGRDLSVLIAPDGDNGDLGSVDVGPLPLVGSLGLVGDAPAVADDSHVVRIYALRGRCTTANGDATALDLGDGACGDTPAALATRLEHGVDAETAADSNGDWQLTRVVAGRIDVVAARHVRNADGSLGALVEVGEPFPYDGIATDLNDGPTTFPETLALVAPDDDVQVQLQLSRTIESDDAFAAFSTGVEIVPACNQGRAADAAVAGVDVVGIDRGSRSVVTQRAAGRYNVVVCDGEFRGSASSLVALPAASAGVWPVVLRSGDSCPLDPSDPGDATRDCDADGRRGLPLSSSDTVRDACAAQCFPDGADARASLGAALGDRTCTVEIDGDDVELDCDDDADGQPDVTEPVACIGAGRGTDLDGDGLCSVVDSYPHCADNTALGCPVGVEDLTPRRVSGGGGGVRIRGPVGTQIEVLGTDPLVTASIDVGATLDGQSLVYGETTAVFDLDAVAEGALTIAVVGDVPGIVCARTRDLDRDIVGCEHEFDLVSRDADDNLGGFFSGGDVVVGGLPEDDSEGRYVAFSSGAEIAGNTSSRQVFWRDRGTGVTLHISTRDGVDANGPCEDVAISADGLTVAFSSSATNLVDDDNNATADVFVWRAADPDVLERIVSATGVEGDGFQTQPALNADGSIVALTSTSSTLAPGITGTSTEYVLRKDLVDGGVTVVSVAFDDGTPVTAREPAISDDGNRIAFWSFSSRLLAADTNGVWDIFVRDATTATTTRMSTTASGAERDQGNESASRIVTPAISGDGRFVSWSTTSAIVDDDDNGLQDVFVTAVDTGVVVWASVGSSDFDTPRGQGERAPLSRDGRFVVFSSRAPAFGAVNVGDLDDGVVHAVVPGAADGVDVGVGVPAISAGSAYVVVSGSNEADLRFDSTGSFAVFTGLADSWWSAR